MPRVGSSRPIGWRRPTCQPEWLASSARSSVNIRRLGLEHMVQIEPEVEVGRVMGLMRILVAAV